MRRVSLVSRKRFGGLLMAWRTRSQVRWRRTTSNGHRESLLKTSRAAEVKEILRQAGKADAFTVDGVFC